jgi:hypothetical protein
MILIDLEGIRLGEKAYIRVYGNPHAFAVGAISTSWEDILQNGKRGRGVAVYHFYGDELWKKCGSEVPNDGFTKVLIYPLEDYIDPLSTGSRVSGIEEDIHTEVENSAIDAVSSDNDGVSPHDLPIAQSEETLETDGLSNTDEITNEIENLTLSNIEDVAICDESIEIADEEQTSLSRHDFESENCLTSSMDNAIEEALILSLKYVIKDKQLPILLSTFWSILIRLFTFFYFIIITYQLSYLIRFFIMYI